MRFGFSAESLTSSQLDQLAAKRRRAGADIIRLTTLSGSGHPGGSLSTLDALLVIYACGNFDPQSPYAADRDRVVVSHGHISPAVYSTLGAFDFFSMTDAYNGFRRAGSAFGGHVETTVPGIEWNTGNLGQGLSAGSGFATAARVHGAGYHTYVLMGDGEQQKGQISEARRYAVKFGLTNLTAFVDFNRLQIGGDIDKVMPQNIRADWEADGWSVLEIDGHDMQAIYQAIRQSHSADRPTMVLLRTVMGQGVDAILNDAKYHGSTLNDAQAQVALEGFGEPFDIPALREARKAAEIDRDHHVHTERDIVLNPGTPRTYDAGFVTDCRSAYGDALEDLAVANADDPMAWPIVGVSCDLEGSVKMNGFHKVTPERFLEVGIMEHHAAVLTGALSRERIVPFMSTFGMFAMVEAYNQQRLNDQNHANPKIVSTHCGLDVGEDGPTHQCIDYVALMRNLFGFEVYVPADANECDRIVRKVATRYAPTAVAMGRSKLPTIGTRDGAPALAGDFVPGKWVTLRPGDDAVVFAFGPMVYRAVQVSDTLFEQGIGLRVINASSLSPIDRNAILHAARSVGRVLTYEDHNVNTGLGAIVTSVLGEEGVAAKVRKLGVTRYGTSGPPDDLFAEQGLAPADLEAAVRAILAG